MPKYTEAGIRGICAYITKRLEEIKPEEYPKMSTLKASFFDNLQEDDDVKLIEKEIEKTLKEGKSQHQDTFSKKRRSTQTQNNRRKRRKKEKEFKSSYELEKSSSPISTSQIFADKSIESDRTKSLPEGHLFNLKKHGSDFPIPSAFAFN